MDEKLVLYIDDEAGDALLMEMYMADHGISIETARNATEGVSRFNPKRHYLVVLDWNLPDANGVHIAEQIRAISKTTPIIFLSGSCTDERMKASSPFTPLACLEKNISMH